MMHPKPRIIVSRATFDQEESVKEFRSRTSTVESEEFEIPRTVPRAEPTTESPRQTLLQYVTAWATELVWCLLSVILLMGLVMVLSTFDERPLPKLPLGLTLNTIVAVLATASRAVTVFLIGQGISQMKWNQYVGTEKPLINLHVYDEASRGPWGSLQMVFRSRGNLLAFLASFLIISSLASSTLTQSAIAYVPRLVAEGNLAAKAPYCNSYPCGDAFKDNAISVNEFRDNLEAAAFGAVFNNVNQKLAMTGPRCQSADCSWPQFDTLAVCYEMKNITENLAVNSSTQKITFGEEQINIASLMSGKLFLREPEEQSSRYALAVNITSLEPNLSVISEDGDGGISFPYPRKSVAFEDQKGLLDTTFSHLFFVHNNIGANFAKPDARYRAIEVLLHFCVQSLDVKVEQGESKTRAVKSYTNITRVNEGTFSIDKGGESDYYEMGSEDEKTTFKLKEYYELDTDLGKAFSGYSGSGYRLLESPTVGEMTKQIALNMFRGVESGTLAAEADEKVWKNLEGVFDTIATGMSNSMREAGLDRDGTALTSVTFVEVRWEWMTLVSAQVGLSIVFLLSVMYGTARLGVDVVKSSNMAELFAFSTTGRQHGGKDRESHSAYQDVGHAGIKTQVAKDVGATLRKGREGWFMEVKPRLMDA